MKKLAATLCLTAIAAGAFAQGTINVANSTSSFIRTNAIASASAGGTAGNTSGGAGTGGTWVYGVFTASSTVTSLSASLQELLSGSWTFTGFYATNTTLATGGRLSGGTGATAQGWTPGVTNSFAVVGWSANLGGQNWGTIAAQLQGATFSGGMWNNWDSANSHPGTTGNAFIGASAVSFGAAGGGTAGAPAFTLFGTVPTAQGNPLTSGFDLFVINVPEPTSFALIGLGTAALVIFRRRKA